MRITTLALGALAVGTLAGCDSNGSDGLSGRYEGTITLANAEALGIDLPANRGGDLDFDAALILDRTSGDNYDVRLELEEGTEGDLTLVYRYSGEGTYDEPDFEVELDGNANTVVGLQFEGEVSDDEETITLEDEFGNSLDVDLVTDED